MSGRDGPPPGRRPKKPFGRRPPEGGGEGDAASRRDGSRWKRPDAERSGPGGPRRAFGPRPSRFAPRGGPRRFERGAPPRDNARSVAVEALLRFEQSRSPRIADVLEEMRFDDRLDLRGRRFANELIYGLLRHRTTVDCIIGAFARERLADLEPLCLNALRLGVYQLLFLDGVPPFAAISESVDLVAHRHLGIKNLVNGLLRGIQRESKKVDLEEDRGGASPRKRLDIGGRKVVFFTRSVFCDPQENLALYLSQVHSHPPFLVERWLARHSAELVESMLLAGNRKPRVYLRANVLKIARDALILELAKEGIASEPGSLPESVVVDSSIEDLLRTRAFADGAFYLQDEAAMKVAKVLAPRAGERILDVCAAPGGKATHLAELSGDAAAILAVDADATRLPRLEENLARLGLRSVTPLAFDPLAQDPRALLERGGPFDAILLDVPCANTGVLARRPEVRWRVTEPVILKLADQARALFESVLPLLRTGGRIALSTCSVEPEENEEQATRLQVAHPQLERIAQAETLPSVGGPDGGYVAVFEAR